VRCQYLFADAEADSEFHSPCLNRELVLKRAPGKPFADRSSDTASQSSCGHELIPREEARANRLGRQSHADEYRFEWFRQINSNLDRLEGDAVLAEFARILNRCFVRRHRLSPGGDEFLILSLKLPRSKPTFRASACTRSWSKMESEQQKRL